MLLSLTASLIEQHQEASTETVGHDQLRQGWIGHLLRLLHCPRFISYRNIIVSSQQNQISQPMCETSHNN
jgi:hypothetical protein